MEEGDHIRKLILSLGLVLVVLPPSAFGAAQKTTRVTGKTMDQCCCEIKNGKFYCLFTKKLMTSAVAR